MEFQLKDSLTKQGRTSTPPTCQGSTVRGRSAPESALLSRCSPETRCRSRLTTQGCCTRSGPGSESSGPGLRFCAPRLHQTSRLKSSQSDLHFAKTFGDCQF